MASAALAGLEEAQEFLYPTAVAKQADSNKRSEPSWTVSKASRDTDKKVFISKKHPQDLLGKDSPGPVYLPKRVRNSASWGFGTAAARPPPAYSRYPETSNNLVGAIPDSQVLKYNNRSASIGTCPRFGSGVIQPDYDGFPPGAVSPGPMRYKPPPDSTYCHRMNHAKGADNIPPRYSIRQKTKIIELESQTGPKIGPGIYPCAEACRPQVRSEKPSLPQWGFSKAPRFPEPLQHGDAKEIWRDPHGEGARKFSRSFSQPPSFSFGSATRQNRKKAGNMILPADKGPASEPMAPQEHPALAPRKEIIKFTDVPAGRN